MSLQDQALLSTDPGFTQRVRTAIIASAIAISNESTGTTNHPQRDTLAVNVLTGPDTWKAAFSASVATDANVISDATAAGTVTLTSTNLSGQAALITDAHINTAVAAQWNSYFTH